MLEFGLYMKHKEKLLVHCLPFMLAIAVGALVTIKAGQDQNWDLLNYHLYNPYALLHGLEGKNIAPAQIQSFYNPILDVPTYLFIAHLRPIVAGSVLGAVQGINLWLAYEISLVVLSSFSRRRGYKLCLFAFMISLGSFFGAVNLAEIGGTMGDNIVSLCR